MQYEDPKNNGRNKNRNPVAARLLEKLRHDDHNLNTEIFADWDSEPGVNHSTISKEVLPTPIETRTQTPVRNLSALDIVGRTLANAVHGGVTLTSLAFSSWAVNTRPGSPIFKLIGHFAFLTFSISFLTSNKIASGCYRAAAGAHILMIAQYPEALVPQELNIINERLTNRFGFARWGDGRTENCWGVAKIC